MSNNANYLSKLNVINAIPDEAIQLPGFPVGAYLQECENLYQWALDDVDKLSAIGVSKADLDDLPVRAGACREAQGLWMKDFRSQRIAQQQWEIQQSEAYVFRNDLLRAMRYAFRNDNRLLNRVSSIANGSSNADMIQDLNDISVLGNENIASLSLIGITSEKLTEAANRSIKLSRLLAIANGSKAEQSQSKILRDKAYTHLKQLADEVYAAGKYLFWNDKKRSKGYSMSYWKNRKSVRKAKVTDQTDQTVL